MTSTLARVRVLLVAGALAGVLAGAAACGSDQSTNSIPSLTAAQLAMHFDTLAGQLEVSHPGDIRLSWYQQIAEVLARGQSPTGLAARLVTGPAVMPALTEIHAYPDTINAHLIVDSTYNLAAWLPTPQPTIFVDVYVRFIKTAAGHPDSTAALVSIFDTTGASIKDTTAAVIASLTNSNSGACTVTPLVHLTVPANPCTKVIASWQVAGGMGAVNINTPVRIAGIRLTRAQ
jgi:hypothetical protein